MDFEMVSADLVTAVPASDASLTLFFSDLSKWHDPIHHTVVGCATESVDRLSTMRTRYRESSRTIHGFSDDE